MMGHNLHFKVVIWKISPKLSLFPILSGAMIGHVTNSQLTKYFLFVCRYDWYQCNKAVTIIVYTKWKDMQHHFVIIDKTDKNLQITVYIQKHVFIIHTGRMYFLSSSFKTSFPNYKVSLFSHSMVLYKE